MQASTVKNIPSTQKDQNDVTDLVEHLKNSPNINTQDVPDKSSGEFKINAAAIAEEEAEDTIYIDREGILHDKSETPS